MAFVSSTASHPYHAASDPYADQHREYHHQHPRHYQPEPDPNMHDSSSKPNYFPNGNLTSASCDIKPRLTKEQHDILESHYQKQPKPNTNTKKGFAENLQVSLDKVNNWFQNRRAKSKQDAKKQAGAYNLFAHQSAGASHGNFSSDSDTSPTFSSGEYFTMLQQAVPTDQMANGMNMMNNCIPQYDEKPNGLPFSNPSEQFNGNRSHANDQAQQLQNSTFDSPQEMNRRTMTQEQFDAMAQRGGMVQPAGQFDNLQDDFSGDNDVLRQVFPEVNHNDYKPSDFAFPASIPAPLSSCDSSIPSTISEQSMFPSSNIMQHPANYSTESLDWSDGRNSSASLPPYPVNAYPQMSPQVQQQPAATTSQWQPGQSVPVDPNALQQQFREVAQRQSQQQYSQEQPPTWTANESFVRRDSQNGTMLAQQMSAFAIQTPQPPHTATFKCPPPPQSTAGGIAARRQKQRPANIGLAALRSQSYSGPPQIGSPTPQSATVAPAPGQQQLRRIRSSNVLGGIAQGRVMKSTPGSAQRSPMAFSFAESFNSPRIARHASTSDLLAPPTPRSPREPVRPQFSSWQSSSGQFNRQASISETDVEHDTSDQAQIFTSPPRTPMFPQPQQAQQQQAQQHNHYLSRVGSNVITENTPPQSAPASQQTFPHHTFMAPPPPHQSQPQPYTPPQTQHFMPVVVPPEPSYQTAVGSFAPPQQFVQPPVEIQHEDSLDAMEFADGVPMVNAQGNFTMAFPAPPPMQQMQFVQHVQPPSQHRSPTQHITPPPHGGQYSFVTSDSGNSPGMQITAGMPKVSSQSTEFFVHEYNPPEDMKNAATVRRPTVDHGPKNYTFNNHGPNDFGKDKSKRLGSMSSPASGMSSS